jgi:hypothetical protein
MLFVSKSTTMVRDHEITDLAGCLAIIGLGFALMTAFFIYFGVMLANRSRRCLKTQMHW